MPSDVALPVGTFSACSMAFEREHLSRDEARLGVKMSASRSITGDKVRSGAGEGLVADSSVAASQAGTRAGGEEAKTRDTSGCDGVVQIAHTNGVGPCRAQLAQMKTKLASAYVQVIYRGGSVLSV